MRWLLWGLLGVGIAVLVILWAIPTPTESGAWKACDSAIYASLPAGSGEDFPYYSQKVGLRVVVTRQDDGLYWVRLSTRSPEGKVTLRSCTVEFYRGEYVVTIGPAYPAP